MYESLCNGVVSEQQRILLGEEEKGIWYGSKHSIATKLDNEYGILRFILDLIRVSKSVNEKLARWLKNVVLLEGLIHGSCVSGPLKTNPSFKMKN